MISGIDMHAVVKELTNMGCRRSGRAAEHRVMEYISDRFCKIGLRDVNIEWFDIHHWEPTATALELLPEKISLSCKPIWYCASTPPHGLTAPCGHCGFGFPQDFSSAKEKIAVMEGRTLLHFLPSYRFLYSYKSAVDAGAVALVILGDTPADLIPIFTAEEEKYDNPIPAVLLNRSAGELLRKHLAEGEAQLHLSVAANSGIARTGDVVGVLPGKTDEYLIVGAHHDAIYQGAVDNAAGISALLAIAAEFAGRPEPPQKTIVFATHPGHELLIGAREFIKRRSSILEKTAAYVTLDGIGCDNYIEEDGKIIRRSRDELRGIFISPNEMLAKLVLPVALKHHIQPAAVLSIDILCPNEDLEGRFYNAGVPIVDIIGKPVWYHTEADTPDKMTPDQLERGTLADLEILEQLDAIPAATIRGAEKAFEPQSLIQPRQTKGRPVIDFTFLPDRPEVGKPCLIYVKDFDDSEGILVDMNWEIRGETGTKGPALLHVFDTPGKHTVRLAVTNNYGAEGRCEKIIEVVQI